MSRLFDMITGYAAKYTKYTNNWMALESTVDMKRGEHDGRQVIETSIEFVEKGRIFRLELKESSSPFVRIP